MMGTLLPALALGLTFSALVSAQEDARHYGFEDAPVGELRSLDSPIGNWSAAPGHAVVDAAHHKSGRRCLHLVGGDDRQIVLEPTGGGARLSELRFWAERWTRRDPFEFRVEERRDGAWHELYRGDDAIPIGTFKAHVRIPLPSGVSRLRITCSSVAGVLLDDFRFARAEPMRVVSATTTQPVVPCLVGNPHNDVARIEVETVGGLEPRTVREVHVVLTGTTDLADVAQVEILTADGAVFGEAQAPAEHLVFRGEAVLQEGANTLRISMRLAAGADIDHRVDAGCRAVVLDEGSRVTTDVAEPAGAQRLGVAVRRAGDDGSKGYRIPGIVTTNAGTLVAVYDVRWQGMRDLPGDIDVGMSRSTDGGRTWEPMRTIMDMGRDPDFAFDGIGDPSVLYDRVRGVVWVAATWSHGNRSWRGSGPGLEPEETGQLMLVKSEDDGVSWSEPLNITKQVKQRAWCFLLQGPGRGICMRDGTLVFPAQFQDTPENRRIPRSTILFSRDGGTTWKLGTGPKADTTEAQVVELEEGVLMLNMRDNRGGARSVYTTTDLGQTWTEHPTSRRALVEPVCNAALLRVGGRRLAFVNPAVPKAPRRAMTVKLSPDLGASWPEESQLLIDAGRSAGYPSATLVDSETLGVFYEGSAALLTFQRIPLAEIRR